MPGQAICLLRLAESHLAGARTEDARRLAKQMCSISRKARRLVSRANAHFVVGRALLLEGRSRQALKRFLHASCLYDSENANYGAGAARWYCSMVSEGTERVEHEAAARDRWARVDRDKLIRLAASDDIPADAVTTVLEG